MIWRLEPDMISYNAAILLQEMWILRLVPDMIRYNAAISCRPQK